MLKSVLYDTQLYAPSLQLAVQKIERFVSSVWLMRIVFVLGLVRNLLLILTYPPAMVADSALFYVTAEHLNGELNAPLVGQFTYPLYPILILLTYKWLGSISWLIGLQFVMSALIAPLYYAALKRYSPTLALIAAVVILGDMQLALMFNFISTEGVYIFFMALTFYVFLRSVDIGMSRKDGLAGGLLISLLLLTRPVARFLIIPFTLIFWLQTRNWKRSFTLLLGFSMGLLAYALLSSASVGYVEGMDSGNYMIATIMINHPEWVSADNGPASSRWLKLRDECPNYSSFLSCAQTVLGGWEATMGLFSSATQETISSNLLPYLQTIWQKTMDFLSLPALVWGNDPQTPSAAQCAGIEQRKGLTDEQLIRQTRVWLLGVRSESQMATFRPRLEVFLSALCPSLPEFPQLRNVVDTLSIRYRSLGRPQPYLWYGTLAALVVIVPWARRYVVLLATVSIVLLNHALISALISNVQPRYVVVTNPLRAILLCSLFYLILRISAYVVDWAVIRRYLVADAAVVKSE